MEPLILLRIVCPLYGTFFEALVDFVCDLFQTDHFYYFCSDQVKAWYSSTDALRWNENPNVPVSDDVKRFLDGFMRGKQFLELEDFWNQCFDLELGQKRVAEKGSSIHRLQQ